MGQGVLSSYLLCRKEIKKSVGTVTDSLSSGCCWEYHSRTELQQGREDPAPKVDIGSPKIPTRDTQGHLVITLQNQHTGAGEVQKCNFQKPKAISVQNTQVEG